MILEHTRTYDEMQHLANKWEGKPKRKGALAELKKLQMTRELQRDLQTASKTDFRHDYATIRRASEIAFGNRVDTTGRIRACLKNASLNLGVAILIVMAVLSLSHLGGW